MYRIAIVEDDNRSSDLIVAYLKRYEEEEKTEIEYAVFRDGLEFISEYRGDCDIVLMDIEMPHMNGLEAARKLREIDQNVILIFITALAKYAIEGYEVRALDFLLKPLEYRNFSVKLRRALDIRKRFRKKELVLTTEKGIQRVSIDDLYYVEVMDHTLTYHTAFGDFSERGSIRQVEENLEADYFCRCNNSYLVNLRHVTSMNKNVIKVHDKELPVGRTKKKFFMEKLTEFMGVYIQ